MCITWWHTRAFLEPVVVRGVLEPRSLHFFHFPHEAVHLPTDAQHSQAHHKPPMVFATCTKESTNMGLAKKQHLSRDRIWFEERENSDSRGKKQLVVDMEHVFLGHDCNCNASPHVEICFCAYLCFAGDAKNLLLLLSSLSSYCNCF